MCCQTHALSNNNNPLGTTTESWRANMSSLSVPCSSLSLSAVEASSFYGLSFIFFQDPFLASKRTSRSFIGFTWSPYACPASPDSESQTLLVLSLKLELFPPFTRLPPCSPMTKASPTRALFIKTREATSRQLYAQ